MAGHHPHQEHREHLVSKSRVGHITRGYATGGAVHDDAKQDAEMLKAKVKPSALKARGGKIEGKSAKHRLDRGMPKRANGGKVGKKKGATTVNVIVAGHGGQPGAPPGPPPGIGAAAPTPMPPPRPPMPPPGMAGPGMPPGGMPPGGPPMMPRAKGGRVKGGELEHQNKTSSALPMRASGGKVKNGPAWEEGLRNGTKVQHSSDKGEEMAEGAHMRKQRKEYNYKTGGAVKGVSVDEKPPIKVGEMGLSGTKCDTSPFPKMKHAAGGGEGRLEKAKKAVRGVSAP